MSETEKILQRLILFIETSNHNEILVRGAIGDLEKLSKITMKACSVKFRKKEFPTFNEKGTQICCDCGKTILPVVGQFICDLCYENRQSHLIKYGE